MTEKGRVIIERLTSRTSKQVAGAKAASLAWLIGNDRPVPETWFVAPGADLDPSPLAQTKVFAVRSSANVEDSAAASYAGQFETRLDVPQTDLADAVAAVRASATGERATEYRRRLGAEDPVEMAVLIQEMVHPVASGVAFSRNPMTGLNEVVVEAVEGRGDRLVDDGVTPDRWTHRWGSWIEQPESGVIDDATASRIVATTRQIAADYGRPVDLEWVWDGSELWWVQ
ncbi:MAG: hypothetical protein HKN93_04625, partial [Acidimicrobiia bacterium]|nr:hypothetical protein [Acidimicrobiia bacterium]